MHREETNRFSLNSSSLPTFENKQFYRARRIVNLKTPVWPSQSCENKDSQEIVENSDFNHSKADLDLSTLSNKRSSHTNSLIQDKNNPSEPAKKALNFDDKELEKSFALLLSPVVYGKRKRESYESNTSKREKRSSGLVPKMMVGLYDPETSQTENFRCFKEETINKDKLIELDQPVGDEDEDCESNDEIIYDSIEYMSQELESAIGKQ